MVSIVAFCTGHTITVSDPEALERAIVAFQKVYQAKISLWAEYCNPSIYTTLGPGSMLLFLRMWWKRSILSDRIGF